MSSDNPNMKLRMPGKDYSDPGYYFCTRTVLGRRHLFGKIKKREDIPLSNPNCAYIDYSPYGIRVAHELENIGSVGQYAGKVEVKGKPVLRRTQYLFPRREKTQEEIQAAIEPYLKLARAGAVLVTPCISPAEQEVVQAAYKENRAVVMLSFQGFGKYYHPSKAHYDACARGLLLQLAPWKFDPGREMRKAQCEELNGMAFRFAGLISDF